jgi:hypothetical protein
MNILIWYLREMSRFCPRIWPIKWQKIIASISMAEIWTPIPWYRTTTFTKQKHDVRRWSHFMLFLRVHQDEN